MTCTSACRKPTGRMAHCGACHRTYRGLTLFDMHRRGGSCNELPGVTEKDGVWAEYGSSTQWWVKDK